MGPSYVFRPLQGHHQGGVYEGVQIQDILWWVDLKYNMVNYMC
jgi:hypothetical protein